MAASVNLERFRREIQLAASLQHPHIVPLLAAGQAGDLLYYTMPLVEGESLRAKLAREGELPVGEAIRDPARRRGRARVRARARRGASRHQARQRADLGAARRGHRLRRRQGDERRDRAPRRSPRSASRSARPRTWRRSRRPPIRTSITAPISTPWARWRTRCCAAGRRSAGCRRSRCSPRTSRFRRRRSAAQRASVPPALNALVMRCLEKKPADRVQSAAEMLTQLQAMATPSGGMAPTGATPAAMFTSGAEAALRRAHPCAWRRCSRSRRSRCSRWCSCCARSLGLPDWVLPGAVVLLAIGLPIMLVTGQKERERVLAAATGTYRIPGLRGVAKHLTWRKAILGGGLAFGALAAIVDRVLGDARVRHRIDRHAAGEGTASRIASRFFSPNSRIASSGLDAWPDAHRGISRRPLAVAEREAGGWTGGERRAHAHAAADERGAHRRRSRARSRSARGCRRSSTGEIDAVGKSYVALGERRLGVANGAVLTAMRETAANDAELIPGARPVVARAARADRRVAREHPRGSSRWST